MEDSKKNKVVMVVGMHRSGTSALMAGLNALGVELGDDLISANEENPKGFFENTSIVELNEDILNYCGGSWNNPFQFDLVERQQNIPEGFYHRAGEILSRFANTPLWGCKDPRISLLLPFWQKALNTFLDSELYLVHALRHPLAVAASLKTRGEKYPHLFLCGDVRHSLLLWFLYHHSLLSFSPTKHNLIVHFDDLLIDPEKQLQRMAKFIGTKPSAEPIKQFGSGFIDRNLQHHQHAAGWIGKLYPECSFIDQLYQQLMAMTNEGDFTPEQCQTILGSLPEPLPLFEIVHKVGVPAFQKANEIGRVKNKVSEFEKVVSARDNHITELKKVVSARDNHITELKKVVSARDNHIYELEKELSGIINSNSWKVTKPYRWLRRVVSNPKRWFPVIVDKFSVSQSTIKRQQKNDRITKDNHSAVSQVNHVQPYSLPLIDRLPGVIVHGSFDSIDSNRETIMVVSHEGSRTGAPILSYNIVKKLLEEYNVVALFLGPGPIAEACHNDGAVTVSTPKSYGRQPQAAERLMDAIVEIVNLKYVLVNSIESRRVLRTLAEEFIPTVTLVHEFAAYTRPVDACNETILWSGCTVFSSDITYSNMIQAYPHLAEKVCEIIPQGRCTVPPAQSQKNVKNTQLVSQISIRPDNFSDSGIVVLGAGYVHIRKGVDLFISCAAKVKKMLPDFPIRFVWVGKGYDPVNEMLYSVYLCDQIRRAGLENYVCFMGEVDDIEAIYTQADILLLSSRMDPLPNVAIDAFFNDLPVTCFDKTTGIAEILDGFELHDFCVANYLDCDDMAAKVATLAQSAELRKKVANQAKEQAMSIFDMDVYVQKLDKLACKAGEQTAQESKDTSTIIESGLLQADFYKPPAYDRDDVEGLVRLYVRSWVSGVSRRKLFPGFHAGIYFEQYGLSTPETEPLADYIRQGKPSGAWNFDLIVPDNKRPDVSEMKPRIALHIHVFYPDLLPDILMRLGQNSIEVELLVTVVNEYAQSQILKTLQAVNYKHKVFLVPNRGRDIGPFITGLGKNILDEYDIIGHIHTKKSLECDEVMGNIWFSFLLENLIGGKEPMIDTIIKKMYELPDMGMVFPCDPYTVAWGDNLESASEILSKWGVREIPAAFEFPVGTMFWARSSVLHRLFDLDLQWDDYPDEPLPYDGTLLHAIERVLGFLAPVSGKSVSLTYVPGVTR